MNCLALDLGTKTGWAVNAGDQFFYGMERLATERDLESARRIRLDRRRDIRIPRLFSFVEATVARYGVQLVVFEDVLFIKSRAQAHLWASQRAAVWMATPGCQIDCLNTTALKAFATKMPSASKDRMIAALKKADPGLDFGKIDDNVADAIWLWRWAQEKIRL